LNSAVESDIEYSFLREPDASMRLLKCRQKKVKELL
jgi:hypothetical protein